MSQLSDRTYVLVFQVVFEIITCTYVRTRVRTSNVMSQLSDWKRAHMCTENHVCTTGVPVMPYHGTRIHNMVHVYNYNIISKTTMVHVYVHVFDGNVLVQYVHVYVRTYTCTYTCTVP
jgi:hypothetical protein